MNEIANIKIDKGIPLPPGKGKWNDLIDSMEFGDSILIDYKKANYFRHALVNRGFRCRSQRENDMIRVWKIPLDGAKLPIKKTTKK